MDPLRHFRDRGGMGGPTKRGISQCGNPTGLEVGAGRVEVALTRSQTMEGETKEFVYSLPCGLRVAEEKVRGCPAPSRLRSDGAG